MRKGKHCRAVSPGDKTGPAKDKGDDMRFRLLAAMLALPLTATLAQAPDAAPTVEKPAALVADGIPPVPTALAAATRPYMEFRTAGFSGWSPRDRSMLITTRFGNINQLHRVAAPMGAREQVSFEAEPVNGSWSPAGDVLAVSKDVGGSEFFQLYTLANGRLTLLTDGRSRNDMGPWSHDGRWLGYSSTRRNGTDADLYVIDPRNPASNRLVAQVQGGGWGFADFSPDGRRALAINSLSVTKTNPFLVDLATGRMTPIGDHSREIAYGGGEFAPDGTLWVDLGRGLGLPAARPGGPRDRAFHAGGHRYRLGRREFRRFRRRPHHRLRHQRGRDQPPQADGHAHRPLAAGRARCRRARSAASRSRPGARSGSA